MKMELGVVPNHDDKCRQINEGRVGLLTRDDDGHDVYYWKASDGEWSCVWCNDGCLEGPGRPTECNHITIGTLVRLRVTWIAVQMALNGGRNFDTGMSTRIPSQIV